MTFDSSTAAAPSQTHHSSPSFVGEPAIPFQGSLHLVPSSSDPVEFKRQKDLRFVTIQNYASRIYENPDNSKNAARELVSWIDVELHEQGIKSFLHSIETGFEVGLINQRLLDFARLHHKVLDAAISTEQDSLFEYFGIRTVYDRYLLKHPQRRLVVESPQYFFMRIACALSYDLKNALDLYKLISSFEYMPSSPTLFNSGTLHEQLSSCFLLDSPEDSLHSIYQKYMDIAKLSKFSGGIGVAFSRVRSRGSLIQSTNGFSNGIIPWIKTLDSSVAAVNQGGKRKGACCVYLECWHADIEEFLELRDNTGDDMRRTHNLNLANWVSDLFMKRVQTGGMWSLFDPKTVPELVDSYGDEFEAYYLEAENEKKFSKQVSARDLYGRMMKTLAQTGNGWMTFKDASNKKSNQTLRKENVIHLSNLCTEILEVTSDDETAVCNLGSVNLAKYVQNGKVDFARIYSNVQIIVRQLDRVIDLNFYPIPQAKKANKKWRPVGLGVMGLQDVFFQLGLAFDSAKALKISTDIQEEVYFAALSASCALAKEFGPHENFLDTRASVGDLQFDLWGHEPKDTERWDALKKDIQTHGLRNSLLIAIAPTATIGSIVGSYECIEPQVSNLFKRETLSGEFLQVNRYLVQDLKKLNLWNKEVCDAIKLGEGSIQHIEEIPADVRNLYRTAWEVPMRALIDMASERGKFIDQGQSLNLFNENPTIGSLSSMYMHAWKKGLKTTYYLRSRPATKIAKTTVTKKTTEKEIDDIAAVTCSLENPESCEACQ